LSHEGLIEPVRQWLIGQALDEPDITELFGELCSKLAALGIPITRGRLIWQTLHPLFRAERVIWDIGQKAYLDHFRHQDEETEAWLHSPFRFVLHNQLSVLRRRLSGPNETVDFPVLEELKQEGITDYLLLLSAISGHQTTYDAEVVVPRGIFATWATNRPGGFSADDLEALQSIQNILAVTCKTAIQTQISRNIATTYLGERAGANVLNGQIRRGDGQRTSAVVWFSDMRDSTMFAESMPADDYFSMLNAHFEATAAPLVEHGGEVLDFIGDAVLGIFPFEDESGLKDAADRANNALKESLSASKRINSERASAGQQRFNYGVGLNVGEVKFGNIGIPQRLSFSVIGHTVNEVARIESMTKLLQTPVLAGGPLAALSPELWKSVGEHKLEGVLDPVELFAFR